MSTLNFVAYDQNGVNLGTLSGQLQGASGYVSGTIRWGVNFNSSVPGVYTIQLYVTDSGGRQSNRIFHTFVVLDSPWMTVTPVPTSRAWGKTAVVDGKIYVIGGQGGATGDWTYSVDVYDPGTDTWSRSNDSAMLAGQHSGCGSDGRQDIPHHRQRLDCLYL